MPDRTLPGIQQLQHVVVLMMENRSFDHMLGALHSLNPAIDGLAGTETNPDTTGVPAEVLPTAGYQGQLDPDPDHHFAAVDLQMFGGVTENQDPNRQATMQGFVKSYYNQQRNVQHSHLIMNYFTPDKLPVLTKLATEYAVFNRWFSSIPGPTLCNRAFAHYGTSFGQVSMDIFYWNKQFKSIYERLNDSRISTRLYYFDDASSSLEVVNLLNNQPELFGTFPDFLDACKDNQLPEYCFVEPNYTDHDGPDGVGELIASDQHPDHDVRAGEQFIASVYKAIRNNFDRFGVRVPAILVSPWVARGRVINEQFEHASIPATITDYLLGDYPNRSKRELAANTFLGYLDQPTMRADDDCPAFQNA